MVETREIEHVKKASVNTEIKSPVVSHIQYLLYLKEVLNFFGIPSVYYSINGYSEDAVCIEYKENNWIVYSGERGKKYNTRYFKDIIQACNEVICRLSESEKDRCEMQQMFEQKIKNILKIKSVEDSTELQIVFLTSRINQLLRHLKENKNDHRSRRELLKTISQRKILLNYLKTNDVERYRTIIERLQIKN